MSNNNVAFHQRPEERGQTIILVAIALVSLLAMAALAIDVTTLYVARGEMQRAADAAALADRAEVREAAAGRQSRPKPTKCSIHQCDHRPTKRGADWAKNTTPTL